MNGCIAIISKVWIVWQVLWTICGRASSTDVVALPTRNFPLLQTVLCHGKFFKKYSWQDLIHCFFNRLWVVRWWMPASRRPYSVRARSARCYLFPSSYLGPASSNFLFFHLLVFKFGIHSGISIGILGCIFNNFFPVCFVYFICAVVIHLTYLTDLKLLHWFWCSDQTLLWRASFICWFSWLWYVFFFIFRSSLKCLSVYFLINGFSLCSDIFFWHGAWRSFESAASS